MTLNDTIVDAQHAIIDVLIMLYESRKSNLKYNQQAGMMEAIQMELIKLERELK